MAEKSWLDSDPVRLKRKEECYKYIRAACDADMAMSATDLPLEGRIQGKVRDIYSLPNNQLLLCATDRQSAFDRLRLIASLLSFLSGLDFESNITMQDFSGHSI